MSINISTRKLKPIRTNYSHIARRIGDDKPASRYQEAVLDVQPTKHFHYPPTWEPEKQLFDAKRTAIKMEDWYSFMDPRQYYYTSYVSTRARQQETMDSNFGMLEKRGLFDNVPTEVLKLVKQVLIPLRHVEYGANMNNQDICDRGFGTSITSLASFNGFDRIGMAQCLSRIALLIDENDDAGLLQAREDWLKNPAWQELRRAMEDIFVLDDWFEIMVAQNVVMDGLLFPLIYDHFMARVKAEGGGVLAMVTEFMTDWYAETVRWTNHLMKVTAAESGENKALLEGWVQQWSERLNQAIAPIADLALGDEGAAKLDAVRRDLHARLVKQGVNA